MRTGTESPCTNRCHWPKPGTSQAHCPTCHHTFFGIDEFDDHRSDGQCVNPAASDERWAGLGGEEPS